MEASELIDRLKRSERELSRIGVKHLGVFGSYARGEALSNSDVDIVVALDPGKREGGFAFFGQLQELRGKLEIIVGRPVDLAVEPIGKPELAEAVRRDLLRAF